MRVHLVWGTEADLIADVRHIIHLNPPKSLEGPDTVQSLFVIFNHRNIQVTLKRSVAQGGTGSHHHVCFI